MLKNKDLATTVLGGIMSAGIGAEPVVNAVQGTMHTKDWFSLGLAVVVALYGWLTNKPSTPAAPQ